MTQPWCSSMDDDRYQRAVEEARTFRIAARPWEKSRPFEVAAADLMEQDWETFVYNMQVLIQLPGKEAWDTLGLIAQTLLRDGKSLPQPLADWVADVLGNRRRRPSKGADRTGNRAAAIQFTVHHIATTIGLKPTRDSRSGGRAGAGRSACDAVGLAWGLGYKTVERIWNERGPYIRELAKALLSESPKK